MKKGIATGAPRSETTAPEWAAWDAARLPPAAW